MNKIDFPRIGVDGISRSREDIVKWYFEYQNPHKGSKPHDSVVDSIFKKFCLINPRSAAEVRIKDYVVKNFYKIITGLPDELETMRCELESDCKKAFFRKKHGKNTEVSTKFNKNIVKAFNYKDNRGGILLELAKKLNVKCCPYCNHQYTLYVTDWNREKAALQFDHFIDKGAYPIFSMSIFNLIPSCQICNHTKMMHQLPPMFNPYMTDISSLFKFRVEFPFSYLTMNNNTDYVDIAMVANKRKTVTKAELDSFDETFLIKAQYARHKDIVEEINYKIYLEPYYNDRSNFGFINESDFDPFQLMYGYTDKKDIEKRPLTKFTQDIREQFNEYAHALVGKL